MNIFPQKEHSTSRYNQNDKFCFPSTGNYALFEPFRQPEVNFIRNIMSEPRWFERSAARGDAVSETRPRGWNKQRLSVSRGKPRLTQPNVEAMRRSLKGNNCFSKLTLPELVPRMNQPADLRAECTRHAWFPS